MLLEENTYQTKFNSALPLIIIVRNAIFGKSKPEGYTRLTVYINSLIWFTFLMWHVLSYLAFTLRDLIFEQKNIDVISLIYCRGEQLGFNSRNFLVHIINFHIYSILIWGIIFFGLALVWRKNSWAFYVLLAGYIGYFILLLIFMNLDFFNQDVTLFDKILLSFMSLNLLIYFAINRYKTKKGTSISKPFQ